MNIIILVKQVPEADKVAVNPETGTLIREGVNAILNPFCEYALDMAVKIRDESQIDNIKIIAITMGPPQAKSALLRCLELGADEAYLLSDRAFAGSDVWATALTIKEGIKALVPDFDLIIAGKQAIDGDTAQVPAEVAEQLGIPQIYYGIGIDLKEKKIIVTKENDDGYEKIETRLPALVTITKGPFNIRRLPTMQEVINARMKKIETITADKLNINVESLGLNGSLTQVVKIFSPPSKKEGHIINGEDPKFAANELMTFLHDKRIFKLGED